MRKLASVVEIASCEPIPDTERLSVATMSGKGWKVVTGRDEFRTGDKAVYFEIDSFLPADDERYAFLRERCLRKFVSKSGTVLREGIRIKTCKLRGVISQGLLMPLDKFPEVTDNIVAVFLDGDGIQTELVGADITSLLKVEHYDEVKEQMTPLTGGCFVADSAYGVFPSDFIPKSDEERIQNLSCWVEKYADRTFEVTCKDDGSSCTMFYSPTVDAENPFGVCSRNIRLKPVSEKGIVPPLWLMEKKYLVEEKLKEIYETGGKELAFQGEYVAPGVQNNRDRYNEPEWHVFRIWDIKAKKFLEPEERRALCERIGLKHVQVVATGMPVFKVRPSVDSILLFAEGKTERGNEREGLVFKTDDGLEPQLSFKAVSNRYLLKS